MKKTFFLAIILACLAVPAMAKDNNGNGPPGNSSSQSTGIGLGVGIAGAAASASLYDANSLNLTEGNDKAYAVTFAAPAWTRVPQAYGCIVTTSSAGSFLFGAASGSKTSQASEKVCVTIRMQEAAYKACQFETAAILGQRVYEEMWPGQKALPIAQGTKNWPPETCVK